MKAFVPPVDPSLEDDSKNDDRLKSPAIEDKNVKETQKTTSSVKSKGKIEKKKVTIEGSAGGNSGGPKIQSQNLSNNRPDSQNSLKRRIGSTTVDANPTTPRQNIGNK